MTVLVSLSIHSGPGKCIIHEIKDNVQLLYIDDIVPENVLILAYKLYKETKVSTHRMCCGIYATTKGLRESAMSTTGWTDVDIPDTH